MLTAPAPAPAPARTFGMPVLQPGTMMIKDGTRTQLPFGPDMVTKSGTAWVVESTPTKLRIYEEGKVYGGFVPVTFDQTLELVAPNQVTFEVTATVFGVRGPKLALKYELTDAGQGWIQLALDGNRAKSGTISVRDGHFNVNLPGPLGTHDSKSLPITQPGEDGYVAPPARGPFAPR